MFRTFKETAAMLLSAPRFGHTVLRDETSPMARLDIRSVGPSVNRSVSRN
jgi:hypothetical protein